MAEEKILLTREELAALMQPSTTKLCRAEFYRSDPIEKKDAEGKVFFEEEEMCKLYIDSKSVLHKKVDDEIRAAYFVQYRRFKETGENLPDGTPLTAWAGVSAGQVATLKLRQIYTVEQLAAAKVADLDFLGGQELKIKASAFLAVKKDTSAAEGFATTAAALKEQKQHLEEQLHARDAELAKMAAQIAALQGQKLETAERPARKAAA